MRKLRSVFSVLLGLAFLGAAACGVNPLMQKFFPVAYAAPTQDFTMLFAALAYLFLAEVTAACFTGYVAHRRRLFHACILGFIWLVCSCFFIVCHWDSELVWFNLVVLILIFPAVWLGGLTARLLPH